MAESIYIKSRKTRIRVYFLLTLVLLAFGVFLILKPNIIELYNQTLTIAIGYVVLISGSIGILVFGLMLLRIKPALIINKEGIQDNSTIAAGYLIEWNDIIGIEIRQELSMSFVIIHLSNATKYLYTKSVLKNRIRKSNFDKYGTPVNIPAQFVNYPLHDLKTLMEEKQKEFLNAVN